MPDKTNVVAAPTKLLVVPEPPRKLSSVIIMDDDESPPTQGTVVSVGSEVDSQWLGKEVIFKRFAGQAFKLGDGSYISLLPDEVLAYLN